MENFVTLHGATNQALCDYYDSHPNLTLVELARRSGKTVFELKIILKGESQ